MTIHMSEHVAETTRQASEQPRYAVPTVRSRRRYGEMIGWIIVGLAILGLVSNMLTNPRWNWETIGEYLFDPIVLQGVGSTIMLSISSGGSGLVFGLIIALMELSKSQVLQHVATAYIGFIR